MSSARFAAASTRERAPVLGAVAAGAGARPVDATVSSAVEVISLTPAAPPAYGVMRSAR